jgi:hypothetical protein
MSMRFRTTLVMILAIGLGSGCQASRALRPPAAPSLPPPPPPVSDRSTCGERKVLLDQMHQMAVEDASSVRR